MHHTLRLFIFGLMAVVAAACGPNKHGNGGPDSSGGSCTAGQMHCAGNTLQTCGADGTFSDSQVCANACSDTLGCVLCVPGTGGACAGNTASVCNSTGTGYESEDCDPAQGSTCNPQTGLCDGPCAPHNIGQSYIGCEYYPTVTGNPVGNVFSFAVAIANTASTPANITIEGGALSAPDTFTVAANSVKVEKLPWQSVLKLCDQPDPSSCIGGVQRDGALVAKGAYHLRSTVPVTVYQFNPLEYTVGGGVNSYSNDASLLLPTNAWRQNYFTANYDQTGDVFPSEFAVTAWHDNTSITLTTRADTKADQGAPAFATGVAQTVMLNAGDVLEVTARVGDLTGSHVTSDKPTQIISGHYCVYVPDINTPYCDHLEESLFSVDALGSKYVVTAPAVVTSPAGKVQVVRFIATQADTQLTYDPPQAGAPPSIANPGDFVQITATTASFLVTSNHKILVAQYMEGSQATADNTGDPSMALGVPVEQFRSAYLFHAPINYTTNYVDVVAPTGAIVMLDGSALTFTPIGTTGYGLARVTPLGPGPASDGNHGIAGTMPFGITVYGYGQDTSYWYPGGLNLADIPVN